jgi:uncharacterized protein
MKSYQRFFLFVTAILIATSLLSPWIAALWEFILVRVPEWEEYRYPFSRIFDRLFMILGIGCFFLWRPLLKIRSLSDLGLSRTGHDYPDLIRGFALAVASLILLAGAMTLAGVFTPYFRLPFATGLERSVKALLTAITVGFLEEIFFRGILLRGMLEDVKPASALLVTNLFYSAIHFLKPSEKLVLSALDPLAGLRHVVYSFEGFLDPVELLPGLAGLFFIGLVLSYAFLRTGSVFLSIGLHAGWVFALKTIRVYGNYRRADLGRLFGASDPKLVSGAASWLMLIFVAVAVHLMTRNRQEPNSKL